MFSGTFSKIDFVNYSKFDGILVQIYINTTVYINKYIYFFVLEKNS